MRDGSSLSARALARLVRGLRLGDRRVERPSLLLAELGVRSLDGLARVGRVVEGLTELGERQPLCEEVGGVIRVIDVADEEPGALDPPPLGRGCCHKKMALWHRSLENAAAVPAAGGP